MNRRAHDGKFTGPTLTAPLLFRRVKSAPHVKGWQKRKAAWVAKRDAKTDDLRNGR